jgi:hypothetical protein
VLLLGAVMALAAVLTLGAVLVPASAEATRTVATARLHANPVSSVIPASRTTRQAERVKPAGKVRRLQMVTQLRETLAGIHSKRDQTWQWQDTMSAARSPYAATAEHSPSLKYRAMVLHLWTTRAKQAQYAAQHPPRLKDWLCIHHYEGAWPDDTGNGYYGGLQMDMNFMSAYGGALLRKKGTADHWTPLEQIWVAERAYESGRGFYPWPNTARWCGLI